MFITKKHLSRRTFLRGAGVTVGLPLLDAMIPAWTALAQTAASPKPRMGFMYLPHGAIMEQWTPAAEGTSFELTPILKPFAPFQKQLTIVSGLENKGAIAPPVHALSPGTWLSCVTPREGQDPHGGVTVDQIAAAHLGQDTPLPSLEVATEGRGGNGDACDRNYGCSYGSDDLVPDADDAAADGSRSAQAVRAAVRPGRHAAGAQGDLPSSTRAFSISSRSEAADLRKTLDAQDRARLGDYLESVREIERRVQKMEERDLTSLDLPDVPVGSTFDQRLNADVRHDRAGLSGQPDARLHLHDGGRRQQPDLQPRRRLRRVPSAVASSERQDAERTSWSRFRPITARRSRSSSRSSRRCPTATARCWITRSCSTAAT